MRGLTKYLEIVLLTLILLSGQLSYIPVGAKAGLLALEAVDIEDSRYKLSMVKDDLSLDASQISGDAKVRLVLKYKGAVSQAVKYAVYEIINGGRRFISLKRSKSKKVKVSIGNIASGNKDIEIDLSTGTITNTYKATIAVTNASSTANAVGDQDLSKLHSECFGNGIADYDKCVELFFSRVSFSVNGTAAVVDRVSGSNSFVVSLPRSVIQGPRGPAGPAGATGSAGPAGAQGPQGLQGLAGTSDIWVVDNNVVSNDGPAVTPLQDFSVSMGDNNTVLAGKSVAIGIGNTLQGGTLSFFNYNANQTQSKLTEDTYVVGLSNTNNGAGSYIVGWGNRNNAISSGIFGKFNSISSAFRTAGTRSIQSNIMVGDRNSLRKGTFNNVYGNKNSLKNVSDNMVFGLRNSLWARFGADTIPSVSRNFVSGNANYLEFAKDTAVYGRFNTFRCNVSPKANGCSRRNYAAGNYNEFYSFEGSRIKDSYAYGRNNYIRKSDSIAVGRSIDMRQGDSLALGRFIVSNATNSLVVGDNLTNDVANAISLGKNSTVPTMVITEAAGGTTTGNVGIGKTSPSRKLHISEAMRIEPQDDAPASPSLGDIYVDSSEAVCVFVDSAWAKIAGTGSCS